jgi:thiosulfate dehydrogenase [quinone] large subunit
MDLKSNFKQPTYLGYLALLRIAVGYHFIMASWPKITGPFVQGHILAEELTKTVVKDPFAWHRAFILGVVVPNSHFFSNLVAFGEMAIGISLLVGCLVRVSSLFGAFHNFNILFAIGIAGGPAQVGINRIFIVLHLVFVMASAGRSLGLDGLLHRRFPSKLF